jgi:hypothetical protein
LLRGVIFAAAIAAAVAIASGPGHAISGSGIVAEYNALRSANGFPAGIVEEADWSTVVGRIGYTSTLSYRQIATA